MIRDDATQAQVDAADPLASTWLAANAGSGKTRVLTDRVARLLLRGVSPQNILCLTYTKAAAAEMQNRLFKRLGSWAMKDDAALRDDLRALGEDGDLPDRRLRDARTLFAAAVETPGGLKIQTIHAFCSTILRRFPVEAGVSPQFREMEDRTAQLLRAEVVDDLASGPEADIVHEMLQHFSGAELDKFLAEIASNASAFADDPDADLRRILDVPAGLTLQQLLANILPPHVCATLSALVPILQKSSSNDVKAAAKLAAMNLSHPAASDLALLEGVLLTGPRTKEPFSPKIGSFPTKGIRDNHPELCEDLNDIMLAVGQARDTRLALQAHNRAMALHAFAVPFLSRYAARKQALGYLDFDDLINLAARLLTDRAVADWVLYRLDGGIDHVLVDEAQDTSPAQWTVIETLTQELTSGEGAQSDKDRTVFVVGDKKQSIYSFQGADPREFDRMRAQYGAMLAPPGPGLQTRDLKHSFRSSQAILRVVDATFDHPDDRAAIGRDSSDHIAFHADMPGRVDRWPVVEKSDDDTRNEEWWSPVDAPGQTHHDVRLADRIAQQISHMIRHETLPVTQDGQQVRRPVTPGDILILVQRRSQLFSEVIRACKSHGLPVAGADRFKVGAVLAVKDLAALLSFLALPEDDLSLAAALRSPLFGWSEQDLYALAQPRDGALLWEALRKADATDTRAIIDDLLDQVDFLRPYDLIARILTRHDGRRRLVARLGAEAEDGIDALLSQALAFEDTGVPSLTRFLSWLATDDLEVKRQMDNQGDQIRVMSVHGSKGLEAPIVILPDTAEREIKIDNQILTADNMAVWKTVKDETPPAMVQLVDDATSAQARERLRLLYVAMTRAERWLIVAAGGETAKSGTAWYDTIARGMAQAGEGEAEIGGLLINRVEHGDWNAGEMVASDVAPIPAVSAPELLPLPPRPAPISFAASDLGGAKSLPGEVDDADEDELRQRGRLLHLLLEHQPADRDVAARLLSGSPDALDNVSHAALIADAFAVMNAPALSHVFASNTLAEVPLTAPLAALDGGQLNGIIDRLIVTDTSVLAVDFKSNRIVPRSVSDVPEGILRQMGAYAAALALIYPDRSIETAILWTANATLMPLPEQIVADALTRVTIS